MFYLFCCETTPDMGSVPAIKTTEYPLSKYGTGPSCQFRFIQVPGKGVTVDITAFERDPFLSGQHDPMQDSSVAVVFDLYPEQNREPVIVVLNSKGEGGIYSSARELIFPLDPVVYAGADEQGWYWGVRFCITDTYLRDKYGSCDFHPGDRLRAAAYKFLNGNTGHLGAISQMKNTDIFSAANLTDFVVRSY